jgi:pentatricopeptide repeat protein
MSISENFDAKMSRQDNYLSLKKEKAERDFNTMYRCFMKLGKIEDSETYYNTMTKKNYVENDMDIPTAVPEVQEEERGRMMINKFSRSNNKYNKRSRSESPPPKKHRNRCGINRGNPGVCSFCRPEISRRMEKTAQIRLHVRELKRNGYASD